MPVTSELINGAIASCTEENPLIATRVLRVMFPAASTKPAATLVPPISTPIITTHGNASILVSDHETRPHLPLHPHCGRAGAKGAAARVERLHRDLHPRAEKQRHLRLAIPARDRQAHRAWNRRRNAEPLLPR